MYPKKKGDIAELVTNLLPKFDLFVACGGDGTVREVAAPLVGSDKKMGIIPMGTGNDLCKTLNIPRNVNQAFSLLQSGSLTQIDVGKCNDFIFLNTLGFGFDGLTNKYAHNLKYLPSFLRYPIAAVKATLTHELFSANISSSHQKYTRQIMISFANGRVEGNVFWIAPSASITDGKLNMITVDRIFKPLLAMGLPFVISGKVEWIPQVKSHLASNFSLTIDRNVAIHADGEVIDTNEHVFNIRIHPATLNMICGL